MEEQTFEQYLKQAREDFAIIAYSYTVSEHLELRTAIDSFLIAYDQSCEQNKALQEENTRLKEKEIRGDRRLVELEHDKTVLQQKLSIAEKALTIINQESRTSQDKLYIYGITETALKQLKD